jgi:predicted O-methyltransferase YrrM
MIMQDFSTPGAIFDFIRTSDFPYYPGAIFPSEMALLLYHCEQTGARCIIESGRGRGYSTAVLAAYGEAKGIPVISIDWETDKEATAFSRGHLAKYKDLQLMVGDGFAKVPGLLRTQPGPIALLLDGPKHYEAVWFSGAAVALGPIGLVAHHNTHYKTPWAPHFDARFPGAHRVEDSALVQADGFAAFRAWERELITLTGNRSLDHTSLVLCPLPESGPTRAYLKGLSWKHTLATMLIFLMWRLGIALPLGNLLMNVSRRP